MVSVEELFEKQKELQRVLGIEIKDDPMEVYYAINGIVQETMEALQEDTRWKETVFNRPGYKCTVNREKKIIELADVFIYLMTACIFSEVSMEELLEAVDKKTEQKLLKFS